MFWWLQALGWWILTQSLPDYYKPPRWRPQTAKSGDTPVAMATFIGLGDSSPNLRIPPTTFSSQTRNAGESKRSPKPKLLYSKRTQHQRREVWSNSILYQKSQRRIRTERARNPSSVRLVLHFISLPNATDEKCCKEHQISCEGEPLYPWQMPSHLGTFVGDLR